MLDKMLFTRQEEAEVEDLIKAEVTTFGESVGTALRKFGWDEHAAGCVGLGLSIDNCRVETGRFIALGNLGTDNTKIEAKRAWQRADSNVVVTLQLHCAELFVFSNGMLCSDFVPQENLVHCFHLAREGRAPTLVMEAEREKLGIRASQPEWSAA